MINEILKMLDNKHPIINKNVNGVDIPLNEEERFNIISKWATEYYEERLNTIRNKRNFLLSLCDWTQTADSTADKVVWAQYRQLLRDFPETITTIEELENPVWPTPPNN